MTSLFPSQSGAPGTTLREWSSLIGIVTAVVGNILISFALNIQRYAHIRIDRDQGAQKEFWDDIRQGSGTRGYGTQQSKLAEERACLNLTAPQSDDSSKDILSKDRDTPTEMARPQASIASEYPYSSSDSTVKSSEKASPAPDKKTYLKSPYWWAGIILMIIGEAGNFLAYGFAPASIVSPLGVVALVSNCVIAPCLLKERFRQRDFWGVMVAIAGAVTVVLSAKNSEHKMGPSDVWAAITRWEFELYLGVTAGFMIVLTWASGRYGERTILIDLGLVGLFGGYTALSTKGVASLLSDTLWRAFTFPVTYLLVFVLVVTALMQIRYVNRALQRFDSTQVIPVQFVLFTISVIIGSAVLYRDFESAAGNRIGKFVGGCLLTFLGVYLITSGRARGGEEGDSRNLDDEESVIGLVDEEGREDELEAPADYRDQRRLSVEERLGDADGAADTRKPPKREGSSAKAPPQTPRRTISHFSSTSSKRSQTARKADPSLLVNPWTSTEDDVVQPSRPQVAEGSVSSPLLPSEAQRSGSPLPQGAVSGRPSHLSRRSMARPAPGPLMAPLSSSLSAVIADERRRAVNSMPSRRHPRSSTRKSGSKDTAAGESTLQSPLRASQVPEQAIEGGSTPVARRSQSVSASLGNLFWLTRGRDKGKSDEQRDGDSEP